MWIRGKIEICNTISTDNFEVKEFKLLIEIIIENNTF